MSSSFCCFRDHSHAFSLHVVVPLGTELSALGPPGKGEVVEAVVGGLGGAGGGVGVGLALRGQVGLDGGVRPHERVDPVKCPLEDPRGLGGQGGGASHRCLHPGRRSFRRYG